MHEAERVKKKTVKKLYLVIVMMILQATNDNDHYTVIK